MGSKLWEKEKLLITSNFSFSRSVFKSLVLQIGKKWLKELLRLFDSLPNGIILDFSKFKALVEDKIIAIQKLKLGFAKIENIVGKGENAVYQHFLLFPQCFQKLSFPEVLYVSIVW